MAERSWFFNAEQTGEDEYDREYLAEDFAKYFSLFISNGIFPNPSTGLQVMAADTPNMTVILKPGYAFINGYAYENTSDYVFNIGVADGVLDRIDSIFIRFYLADRTIKAYKEVGKASSEPTPGELIRTEDYWDLCVAQIAVDHGVTAITQSAITDTRLDTDLCGIVHAVVDHIDTKTLYKQIKTDLSEFKSVSQAEFNAWFEAINAKLEEGPATALQKQIDEITPQLLYLYKATFKLDSWSGDGPYTQTVALTPVDGGPAVTADFTSDPAGIDNSLPEEAKAKLRPAAAAVFKAARTLGSGTVSVSADKKPMVDTEVYFWCKKGVE